MSYRETVRKHKQIIIIVAAVGAIASYMLPLDSLFAVQGATHNTNKANDKVNKANDKVNKANDKVNKANDKVKTGKSKSGDTCFSNGVCAQLGGPEDNFNVGHDNSGTHNIGNNNGPGSGNIGNSDSGNGNTGNSDSGNGNIGNSDNENNNVGNFCGHGKGHHYGCILHNPHFIP
jgi:hypothetical protein